jgi:hypothetical protein
LPSVNRLHTALRARGLEVVLVNFRESPDLVRRTALDESGDVTGRIYGVFGPPTMYFIDRQGRLIGRAVGPRNWESPEGRRFIEALVD